MSKQEEKLERVYTVPLTKAWITARHKRTKRAVRVLREFAEHHMKSSEIKIDTSLNERLWNRGITQPPRRITVKMEKDEDGVITISLPKEEKQILDHEISQQPLSTDKQQTSKETIAASDDEPEKPKTESEPKKPKSSAAKARNSSRKKKGKAKK